VSGKNRTTFTEMMRLDRAYARKKNFWMDLGILFRTLPAVAEQVSDSKRGNGSPAANGEARECPAPAEPDAASTAQAS
jgi:hypothetical protein